MAQGGDLKGAIEQYQQVLRLTPGSAVAHYNLGVLSLELKSEDEAREHFCRGKVRSSCFGKVESSCSKPAHWPDERTGDAGVNDARSGSVESLA
jgi:tetratricopeptide repeat protein